MKQWSLTGRFLQSLAETIDSLNIGPVSAPLNPTVAVFSTIVLTGIAAFSHVFIFQVLTLAASFVLILTARSSTRTWARLLLYISVWTVIVAIPLPFITSGEPMAHIALGYIELSVSREGLNTMLGFVLRVVSSAAMFTSLAFVLGWRRIVMGLEGLRMPRELGSLLNLSVIHIPLFLRETIKMLSARESRIMRRITFKKVWEVLSTVVADLIIRSYERAWIVEKAIKARTFTPSELPRRTAPISISVKDLLLLSFSLYILASAILAEV